MVVGLDVGQRRGQTDGSEDQMGGKVGFRVNCRVWGYESCGGESISFEYRRDNLNIIQSDSTIGITS